MKATQNNALTSVSYFSPWRADREEAIVAVIHGTTKRQVAQLFQVEQPALVLLPAALFPCFKEGAV